MSDQVALGIEALTIAPGTHMCGFFHGDDERDVILRSYLGEGLRAGDKCLCAFGAEDQVDLAAKARQAALDVDDENLDIVRSQDIYFGQGDFDIPAVIAFWGTWAASALDEHGYPFARMAGEVTNAICDQMGPANLAAYERALNRFVPKHPQVLLCLYDMNHFSGGLLVDILRSHPQVLIGSTVLDNLYYVAPDADGT
jgi:hypothetical protein